MQPDSPCDPTVPPLRWGRWISHATLPCPHHIGIGGQAVRPYQTPTVLGPATLPCRARAPTVQGSCPRRAGLMPCRAGPVPQPRAAHAPTAQPDLAIGSSDLRRSSDLVAGHGRARVRTMCKILPCWALWVKKWGGDYNCDLRRRWNLSQRFVMNMEFIAKFVTNFTFVANSIF